MENRMRILFIHSPPDIYGASRSLLRLCNELRTSCALGVVLPGAGPLAIELTQLGVEVIFHPELSIIRRPKRGGWWRLFGLPVSIIHDLRRLVEIIGAFDPDIVHTNHALMPTGAIAAMLTGRPHIWHIREIFVEFPWLWSMYRRGVAALSSAIICNSQVTAHQFLGRDWGRLPIKVIYNGVSGVHFEAGAPEKVAAFRARYQLSGRSVGVVGRVKLKTKGQEILVRAAALLAKEFPDVRFVCVGDTYPGNEDHLTGLRRLATEIGVADRLVVAGDVDDVITAISALDVVVMPSVHPGPFGNVVMEAMAQGKPVVATSNGGGSGQVADGVTGFRVPPGDAGALSRAIRALLSSPELRTQMGLAGARRVAEIFSARRCGNDVLALYGDVSDAWGYEHANRSGRFQWIRHP